MILVPVAMFYILRFGVKIFKECVRKGQIRHYHKDKYTVLRMRVPRDNEKGPLVMEQIFASLYGVFKKPKLRKVLMGFGQDKFSFEIANVEGRINFYVHVSKRLKKMVEGQFYAQYPGVEIEEVEDYLVDADMELAQRKEVGNNGSTSSPSSNELMRVEDKPLAEKDEYSSFSQVSSIEDAVVAEMKMYGTHLWPVKTYKEFVTTEDKTIVDPLSSLTTAISNLNNPTDKASIQFVVRPEHHYWQKFGWKLYSDFFIKGYFKSPYWFLEWFLKFYLVNSWAYHVLIWVPVKAMKLVWRVLGRVKPIENISLLEKQEVGFAYWEIPKKKLTTLGFQVDIRLFYQPVNKDVSGAYHKVKEMAAGFNQFQYPYVNGFGVARMSQDKELIRRFRERDFYQKMILGIDELATIFHLPIESLETPNIQWVLSKKLEPPVDLPTPEKFGKEVTVMGRTNFRGRDSFFGIKEVDRRRHVYVIGKTGMGKSTLLENMIYSDIQNGKGVAVIDPHGDLADYVMSIIPSHRINDVVVFNPSDRDYPVSFNMLECDSSEQRNLVASGLLGVFKKMYAESWGPRLEHILRNTILALTEYPGATMLGILRMLSDKVYRDKVIEKITDPVVKSFWVDEFGKMNDKFRTEAIAPIQNKVGQFLSSSLIRNILGQPKSSIDVRFAMDTKKIIIVNLSKGKIGEDNSALLGAMLVTKFQLDAMSRADIPESQRTDFYLYVDEFQNFATESFATILSEARKYKLNLTMANQYIEQMPEEVQAAVFGNVGSLFTFQVGYTDADYIAKQFGDEEMTNDVLSLEKYTGYFRLLIDNMPSKPFSVATLPSPPAINDEEMINKVLKVSRERYSAERLVVEDRIQRWSETAQKSLADSKKLPPGAVAEDDVRHEKNKGEFEEAIKDAGLEFKLIPKESYEAMGIDKATNEHIYIFQIPNSKSQIQNQVFCFSSLDPQGNCFKKKRSEMIRFFEQDEKKMFNPVGRKVAKTSFWKHYLREALEDFGGKEYELPKDVPVNEDYDYRHAGNKKEVEKILEDCKIKFEAVERNNYDKYGIVKGVNEVVYLITNGKNEGMLFYSTIDPQGNIFRKKKFDSFKLLEVGGRNKEPVVKKEIERDGRWKKALRKELQN